MGHLGPPPGWPEGNVRFHTYLDDPLHYVRETCSTDKVVEQYNRWARQLIPHRFHRARVVTAETLAYGYETYKANRDEARALQDAEEAAAAAAAAAAADSP